MFIIILRSILFNSHKNAIFLDTLPLHGVQHIHFFLWSIFRSPEPKADRLAAPASVGIHNFKHLLYHFANQSQILCGASLGRGSES